MNFLNGLRASRAGGTANPAGLAQVKHIQDLEFYSRFQIAVETDMIQSFVNWIHACLGLSFVQGFSNRIQQPAQTFHLFRFRVGILCAAKQADDTLIPNR